MNARTLGYAGVVLLVAAAVIRLVVPGSGAAALGVAVAGTASFLVYFLRSGSEMQRFLDRRSTREGGSVFGMTVFVIGTLILVNLLGARFRWHQDITADRRFTPAPETVSAIEAAPEPPEVWVFHPEGSEAQAALRELLEAARLETSRLHYHIVDPERDPADAIRFGLTDFATVVQVGENRTTVTGWTEVDLLSGILRATSAEKSNVGFLSGHGEAFLGDTEAHGLRQAGMFLDTRGFALARIDLLKGGTLADADLLVVAGPRVPLEAAEVDSLLAFLQRGGSMLVLLDPAHPVTLEPVLEPMGLRFDPRFVSDPDQRDPQVILPADLSAHPAVLDLRNRRIQPALRGAGEVTHADPPEGRTASLLYTGNRARPVGDATAPPTRRALAAAAERRFPGEEEGSPARMVVVGDSDFLTNAMLGVLGNGDLYIGAVQWLTEREDLVAVRPRARTDRPVVVSRQQGRALMVLLSGLLPVSLLVLGGVVWWKRR